ncbi:hypothetical protein FKM82_030940 [Ascaphus truei]
MPLFNIKYNEGAKQINNIIKKKHWKIFRGDVFLRVTFLENPTVIVKKNKKHVSSNRSQTNYHGYHQNRKIEKSAAQHKM